MSVTNLAKARTKIVLAKALDTFNQLIGTVQDPVTRARLQAKLAKVKAKHAALETSQ